MLWSLLGVGIVLVIGGAIVATAYYQTYRIYDGLKAVTPALTSARNQLAQGQIPANDELGIASGLAGEAQLKIDHASFPFRFTRALPFFGRPIHAIELAATAASEESEAAQIVRGIVVQVLGADAPTAGGNTGAGTPVFRNGVIDVGVIQQITPSLQQLIGHLRTADAAIRAIPSIPFVHQVASLKAQALTESTQAIQLAQRAISGVHLLPGFLGADGPKTYYLALQNNADQRGTGGAVLAYAIVTIDNGHISLTSAGPIPDLDNKKEGITATLPAAAAWYTAHTHVVHRLANAGNYSPDFRVAGRSWAAMLKVRLGRPIDGVIALDPYGVASALQGQRAILVPNYPAPITSENVAAVTENKQYLLPREVQDILPGELIQGAYQRITTPTHFLGMLHNLTTAIVDKHIQIWSADPEQEGLLGDLGWDGATRNAANGDYLNLAYEKRIGNKVDYYLKENATYDVTVNRSGGITSSYQLGVEVPVPPNLPQQISGQARPYGVDIAMFNLYVPQRARFGSVSPPGDFPADVVVPSRFSDHVLPKGFLEHTEGAFRVFTQTILAWPGSPGGLTFRYTVPGVVKETADGKVYTLTVQHQPMSKPQDLTVNLTLPRGSFVKSLGTGWTLHGNVATYHGMVTRDFTTQVVFS